MLFQLRQDGTGVITAQGTMDSSIAASFKKALLQALDAADRVELDLSAVETMEILNLQLVCSAFRTARSTGKDITLGELPHPALDRAVEEVGYSNIERCG